MSQILPRHHFYAAIVFTMLVLGVVSFLTLIREGSAGDGSNEVPGFGSQEEVTHFNSSFNIQNNLTNNIESLQNKMEGLRVENIGDVITLPIALIQTGWEMIKFIINSFGFMNSIFVGLSGFLGIPTWLPPLIILFIVALFVFSILSIIFSKNV